MYNWSPLAKTLCQIIRVLFSYWLSWISLKPSKRKKIDPIFRKSRSCSIVNAISYPHRNPRLSIVETQQTKSASIFLETCKKVYFGLKVSFRYREGTRCWLRNERILLGRVTMVTHRRGNSNLTLWLIESIWGKEMTVSR